MHKKILIIICFFHISWAQAATEIELVNERTRKGQTHTYTVKILSDGEKAHYTFHTNYDSKLVSGSYMLSLDGGKTAYFVSRKKNGAGQVCHQWTNQELVQMLGDFLIKVTQRFNVDIANPVVTKVFEHDAEDMLGLPVKHIRVITNLDASYKFLMIKGRFIVERQFDAWVTPSIEGVKTKPIFQRIWQTSGYPQIDLAIKEVSNVVKGHLMRSEITQTEIDVKKNKTKITRIVQYVKSIKKLEKLPEAVFEKPVCESIDADDMDKKFVRLLSVLAGKPL